MSHPKNKRDRFLIGKRHGENRAMGLYSYQERIKRPESFEIGARRLRDTTKLCSASCCANPRHNGWSKNDGKITMQERKFKESIKKDF